MTDAGCRGDPARWDMSHMEDELEKALDGRKVKDILLRVDAAHHPLGASTGIYFL